MSPFVVIDMEELEHSNFSKGLSLGLEDRKNCFLYLVLDVSFWKRKLFLVQGGKGRGIPWCFSSELCPPW